MQKFTDDELKKALENNNYSTLYASRALQVSEEAVRKRRNKLSKNGWSPDHSMLYEVFEGYKVKGVSTYYDAAGNIIGQWVKSREDGDALVEYHFKEVLEGYKDELPKYSPLTIYNEHSINEDLMAVLPIGDLHVGMMSWRDETGVNWDLKHVE